MFDHPDTVVFPRSAPSEEETCGLNEHACPTNPKDVLGLRKPMLCLVPQSANLLEAVVLALGAKKYGSSFNWRRQNVGATTYIAAAQRHLAQWFDGQDNDPESGVSHLAHARACLGILLDAQATGHLIDDRPPPGVCTQLIEQFTEVPLEATQ